HLQQVRNQRLGEADRAGSDHGYLECHLSLRRPNGACWTIASLYLPARVEKACANKGNFVLSQLLDHGYDIRRLALPRRSAPLHCMAISACYEQRMNEVYSWDGRKRGTAPFLVIQHTTYGEGRIDYAGAGYRLVPGQTMLVTMPHEHRYWLERGGHWEYFWMVLNGREALRLAREVLEAGGPVLQ